MKPVILFTNFWDANKLLENGSFLFWQGETLFNVKLLEDPSNYLVSSIALSHPKLNTLPVIKSKCNKIDRLTFFCPTYEMLRKYKDGGSWENYVTKYKELIKQKRSQIMEWFNNLKPNHLYILCCWENTSKKAHCHRQILFKAFTESKTLKDKAIYTYRDGKLHDVCGNKLVDQMFNQVAQEVNHNPIPITVGSQGIADALSVSMHEAIGVANFEENGSWQITVNPSHQNVLETLFSGNPTITSSGGGS